MFKQSGPSSQQIFEPLNQYKTSEYQNLMRFKIKCVITEKHGGAKMYPIGYDRVNS